MTDGAEKTTRCPRRGADISICAEARLTRRRNGATFRQYVLGACCACPSASWNECSTATVSMFAITARKPFDAPTQVDAGWDSSRHVARATARWPSVGHDEAKDAVACFVETEERRHRGRHSPSEGRLCAKTDSWGVWPERCIARQSNSQSNKRNDIH
jgi:hypothetical protein